MILLFLLALLLAWPTMGLSLVAYLIFWIFRAYIRAKSDIHSSNQRVAFKAMSAGANAAPSWAEDKNEGEIFVNGIQRDAMRKGVPRIFLLGVLQEPEAFRDLVYYAGAMEAQGASFIEQQVAVAARLVEVWEKAPAAVREKCLSS